MKVGPEPFPLKFTLLSGEPLAKYFSFLLSF